MGSRLHAYGRYPLGVSHRPIRSHQMQDAWPSGIQGFRACLIDEDKQILMSEIGMDAVNAKIASMIYFFLESRLVRIHPEGF